MYDEKYQDQDNHVHLTICRNPFRVYFLLFSSNLICYCLLVLRRLLCAFALRV